jgi:murein DD-endopeptidase MepM/ murein hydrolase activator NlpD
VLSLGTALLFVGATLALNSSLLGPKTAEDKGILGGPALSPTVAQASGEAILAALPQAVPFAGPDPAVLTTLSEASFSANAPLSSPGAALSAGALQAAADEEIDSPAPSPKPTLRLSHYFIQPATGTNWGILHAHNAVDIANVCGTSVVASADGIVTSADASGNWNGGYGNSITIEHPNGTQTKYAHLQSLTVTVGDEVRQGSQIGTVGNTGHVIGATGCHLHFEVYGAVNPFAKK